MFNRYAETDESYDLEFLFTTFKGNRIWIRTAGKAVKKYGKVTKIVGSFVDITERKAVERAMNQSEAKFRLLYEIAPVAYQSLDESGCFLDVNQAFLDSVG